MNTYHFRKLSWISSILILFVGIVLSTIPSYASGLTSPTSENQNPEVVVEINGTVSQKMQDKDLFFISGKFTQVRVENGSIENRENVAILDLQSRKFTNWRIDVDGEIYDMAISNDLLFIGGNFTRINSINQAYFAVFDIPSRKLLQGSMNTNGVVTGLEVFENTVFISGGFTKIGENNRSRLGSYDAQNRKINSWSPQVNNTIYSMMVYGNRLYIGGAFTEVNALPRKYSASFLLPSGELVEWNIQIDSPVRKIFIDNNAINVTLEGKAEVPIPVDTITLVPIQPTNAATSVIVQSNSDLMVNVKELGFSIPTLSDVLTFTIRVFFVIAGLTALFYLLLGALAWVTSGGEKDSVTAAREKIQAAVIGVVLIVAMLAVVWTLEQVIFARRICFGLSCPLTLPALLKPNSK